MLVNLSTLDVLPGGPKVLQAWSPELQVWVCLVEKRQLEPPAGVIEVTRRDISQMAELRSQGQSREQALAAIGVDLAVRPATRL